MSTVDSEDNLIVTGYWQNYQIFTRKYDISGNLLWEVADASGISGKYEKSNWINIDADNNILVVGNIYSYSSSTGWDYPSDIVALKYSPSGALLWKTILPISITITSINRFNTHSHCPFQRFSQHSVHAGSYRPHERLVIIYSIQFLFLLFLKVHYFYIQFFQSSYYSCHISICIPKYLLFFHHLY